MNINEVKHHQISSVSGQMIEEACEWAIMHGVAFKQADNTARHCPFSLAPIAMERSTYEHLLKVTPLIDRLISRVSEDHDFIQSALADMSRAEPFFSRLMALHKQAHNNENGDQDAVRQPLLLMRTDYMDDRQHGARVIEFNGIAAGMGPFGQRTTEFHRYINQQWPVIYRQWQEHEQGKPVENQALEQLANGITVAAKDIKTHFNEEERPVFLMVVQENEDNVYDQHLLELALQKRGLRTVRRSFQQLRHQLSTGDDRRLLLNGVGAIDVVYLRAGYQFSDYQDPELNEPVCCQTLSQIRLFIEQHRVAVNATISQQLATSKSMQMQLTLLPAEAFSRWGLTVEEALSIKSVLADMKPVNAETISWFETEADQQEWVLKNQGEGGGHCVFGEAITEELNKLSPEEYDAWALMQRLYPHERDKPTIAVRNGVSEEVNDLVSEVGLFTASYQGKPVTELGGYAGYLIRSKPASENEGGIHSGKGILDSLTLVD